MNCLLNILLSIHLFELRTEFIQIDSNENESIFFIILFQMSRLLNVNCFEFKLLSLHRCIHRYFVLENVYENILIFCDCARSSKRRKIIQFCLVLFCFVLLCSNRNVHKLNSIGLNFRSFRSMDCIQYWN